MTVSQEIIEQELEMFLSNSPEEDDTTDIAFSSDYYSKPSRQKSNRKASKVKRDKHSRWDNDTW